MHTFKSNLGATFIFNPDLSGEMEILVKGLTDIRARLPAEAMAAFIEHLKTWEDDDFADTELDILRKKNAFMAESLVDYKQLMKDLVVAKGDLRLVREENRDLWNDLRLRRAMDDIPMREHICKDDSMGWGVCDGCARDKERRALADRFVLRDKMSTERYKWLMRDPLKDDTDA